MVNSGIDGGIYPRGFDPAFDWPWPLVKAKSVVRLNYGRALREGDRSLGQIPVYGTNGQCGFHNSALASGPGVILGRKGQGPLGVEWCDSDYWVIDTAYFVTPLDDRIDLRYFYYLTKYIGLNHLKDGTSNPGLSRDTFGDLLLPLPPMEVQLAIAGIVRELDDKIELNRKMNETLETMARALFKSWFVDFDPVRAKAEGRDTSLPTPIADLFPDSFEDSDHGEIPRGWPLKTMDEEFRITMGQSPPGDTYSEENVGLPFYQGRTDFGDRYPRRRIYCSAPTRLAESGDTLVSVRAPVGSVNMAYERCCIGRGVAAVRHLSGASSYTCYALQALKYVFNTFEAEGNVFGSISKKDFHAIRQPAPPPLVVGAFERLAGSLDQGILANSAESDTLAELREVLLPRVISGELRITAVRDEITAQ